MQIYVHDPNVSTEASFLTIALDLAIFCIPNAKVNVNTAGRPSGIAATARETAVIKLSRRFVAWKNSMKNTNIQTIIDMIPIFLPNFPTLTVKGVSSSSS